MSTNYERTTKTQTGYAGIEYTYTWLVYEDGRRWLESVKYSKNGRRAVVSYMPGYMPWGRENAYMTPYNEDGTAERMRSYKDKHNAQAKAIDWVLGK